MILYQFRCAIKYRPNFLLLSLYFNIVCNMDLVDLINRYTPPSNPMEYLTEQGYFVIIRDENGKLIPYSSNKPQNLGDVLIVVNNDLMMPPIPYNRTTELTKSSDPIRCNEVMVMGEQEIIDLTKSIEPQEENIALTAVSDILRCNEVMEMGGQEIIDLTKSIEPQEENIALTAVSDILRCDEVMEDTHQVSEVSEITPSFIQPKQNIKIAIKDPPPQSACYWKECYDYMAMKNKVMTHIKNKSKEQIVVCGTIEDLKALNTEIMYHKGLSTTKFIF